MHRVVVAATYLLLGGALILALLALLESPDWDRGSIALTLLAAVTGLILDRWVTIRERRRDLLRGLSTELHVACNIFKGKIMQPEETPKHAVVYPQFPTECLETCLASGAFTEISDKKLLKLMYMWRSGATEFNMKTTATQDMGLKGNAEERAEYHKMVTTSAVTRATNDRLMELVQHLVTNYEKESGIGVDTIMLPD